MQPTQAVIRVVKLDSLWVEGDVPAAKFARAELDGQRRHGRRRDYPRREGIASRQGHFREARSPIRAAPTWSAPRSRTAKSNGSWLLSPGMQAEMNIQLQSVSGKLDRSRHDVAVGERQAHRDARLIDAMVGRTATRSCPPYPLPTHQVRIRGHPSRQSAFQFRTPAVDPAAARPHRAPPALPGPQLLDRQGPGGAELLPLPGRGIRPAELAGRRRQPGRDEGPLRGGVPPAEDHPGRAAAVPRHVAPQRAGDRRRGRPGQAVAQAPPRTPPQGIPRRLGQRPLHPLQGLRPRAVPQLALSLGELVLHAARR